MLCIQTGTALDWKPFNERNGDDNNSDDGDDDDQDDGDDAMHTNRHRIGLDRRNQGNLTDASNSRHYGHPNIDNLQIKTDFFTFSK